MSLAQRIMERMEALHTNPHRVATAAGLDRDYVRNILRGKSREPGYPGLKAIADVLQTTPEDLMSTEAAPNGTLQSRIRSRLAALGLTEITAATRAGLPRDTIRNTMRNPGSAPRTDTLREIAKALDTTAAWLLGEEGAAEPPLATPTQGRANGSAKVRLQIDAEVDVDTASEILYLIKYGAAK